MKYITKQELREFVKSCPKEWGEPMYSKSRFIIFVHRGFWAVTQKLRWKTARVVDMWSKEIKAQSKPYLYWEQIEDFIDREELKIDKANNYDTASVFIPVDELENDEIEEMSAPIRKEMQNNLDRTYENAQKLIKPDKKIFHK